MRNRQRSVWVVLAAGGFLVGSIVGHVPAADAAVLRTLSFSDVAETNSASGDCDEVTIDSYGGTIAFVSTANLTGSNADGNSEVYAAPVFFQAASTPKQVTNTTGSIQAHPKLNGDGSVLIFQSTGNLDPAVGNADGSVETFQIDWFVPGAPFKQLTINQAASGTLAAPNPSGRVSSAASNGDGTIIVFSSSSDQIPNTANPDRNPEIFVYDRLEDAYYQVTQTGAGVNNLHPVIDDEGFTAAYVTNVDGNYEVHVVNIVENPVEEDPCVIDPASCGNVAPTITVSPTPPLTVEEGRMLQFLVTVSDENGDAVALRAQQADGTSLVPLGVRAAYDPSSCDPEFDDCTCSPLTADCFLPPDLLVNFTWTPTYAQGGRDYQILLKAVDEVDPTVEVTQLVTVTVVDVNQPPTIAPATLGTKTVKTGKAMQPIAIAGMDADCGSLTMTASLPPGAALSTPVFTACPATPTATSRSSISANITWTPTAGQEGTYPISVSVSDGTNTVTASGTIIVVLNRPPVITTGNVTAYERECLIVTMRGMDPDGDPYWFDVEPGTLPPTAEFLRGTGALHWHPKADLSTPATQFRQTVRVTVSDGTDTVSKDIVISVVDSPDDQAVFVAPTSFSATVGLGAAVPLAPMVRNTGYVTWDGSYTMVPDFLTTGLTAPASVGVPSLAPGAVATLNVSVQAPARAGTYYVRFRMAHNGQKFGASSVLMAIKVQ